MDTMIHSVVTFIDLLSLTICIGALGCRLWVLPRALRSGDAAAEALLKGLWRLILACMVVLVVSSAGGLVSRTVEMTSRPLSAVDRVLPVVLFKTHYGDMWIARIAALTVLWIGWWVGRSRPDSRWVALIMLCAGLMIAFTRSASGHAADAGDLRPPELSDWLHLIAASFWGGGLVALSTVILPRAIKMDGQQQKVIADVAGRFSTLAGFCVAVVLLSGIYNAWIEVRHLPALLVTPYGRTLLAKIILFPLLLFLGGLNRYTSVPLLQQWAGHDVKPSILLRLPILRSVHAFESRYAGLSLARRFFHKVSVEAILFVVVLMCAALLTHEIPARHASHEQHEGRLVYPVKTADVVVAFATRPEKIKTGIPVTIVFSVKDREGRPVKNLSITHERFLHVIIASADFNDFAHIHPEDFGQITPEMSASAEYAVRYRFPRAGKYIIAVDSAVGGAPFSKHFTIDVPGEPKMGSMKKNLSKEKKFGDYLATLSSSPEHIVAGKEVILKYSIRKGAEPVIDLEPYLAAPMHLAVISADLGTFIHVHGELPGEHHGADEHMHMTVPEKFGPTIEAHIMFPAKGLYQIFSEIRHHGRVVTLDFMVEAE